MTGIDIDFYCRVYDDFLSPKDCEDYIDKYNETLRVDNEKWKNLSVCFKDGGEKIRFNTYWPAIIDNDFYETNGALILTGA